MVVKSDPTGLVMRCTSLVLLTLNARTGNKKHYLPKCVGCFGAFVFCLRVRSLRFISVLLVVHVLEPRLVIETLDL